MADEPETRIYLATVDGVRSLYRSTDPRLVRKHIIDQITAPKIEVRIPSTEEAMDAALDGLQVKDITKKPEPDLLTGGGTQGAAQKEPAGTLGGAQIVGDDTVEAGAAHGGGMAGHDEDADGQFTDGAGLYESRTNPLDEEQD